MPKLTIANHSRLFATNTYIYPVVSRRSQGLSLGINLNLNNSCNWRCRYCQVEDLIRGKPIDVDVGQIEQELNNMLEQIVNGDFIEKFAPQHLRRFNDICIAGNGEPTLSQQFTQTVEVIAKLRQKYNLQDKVKTILITNGSEVDKPLIANGIKLLAQNNGEVWFKVDSATEAGINTINQVHLSPQSIIKRLILTSNLCTTYIQTCMFRIHDKDPSSEEINQYIDFVVKHRQYIAGVLLYSTARNPALPEGQDISSVTQAFLANVAQKLEAQGILVKYYQ